MQKLVTITLFVLIVALFTGSAFASDLNTNPPASTTKLVFIHHSCGGNWLGDGNGNLGQELNDNNYYVTETNYGWDAAPGDNLGDRTDTSDWPSWFNNDKMPYVYSNNQHSAYTNKITNPGGENQIIMFKSCYPCSEVGDSITDEKAIYNSLLPYFQAHQNKLFVLITPPGETNVASYLKTRELCNWLVDTENGWLKDYTGKNVFVFDFYCVLSEVTSHHRVYGGDVEHVYASNYDGTSPYHNGDNHPNAAGNQKATTEFIPLLNYAYNVWMGSAGPNMVSSDPADKAVNVPLDKVININFDKDIQAGNLNILLKNSAGTSIANTPSILGNVLTITPTSPLQSGTKYSLILNNGCVEDMEGNPFIGKSLTFSTPPTVVSVNPAHKAVNVYRGKEIKVTFSTDVKEGANFWVELKNKAGTSIAITKTILGNVLTIKPNSLLPESKYTICLHTGCVTDLNDNPLKAFTSQFSVGHSPYLTSSNPKSGATNVARNKTLTLTFNENIKKSSNCWIELKSSSGKKIPITISTSGKTLTIKHSQRLAAKTRYTLSLHTGCITDLAGNPLKLLSRKFTTGSS